MKSQIPPRESYRQKGGIFIFLIKLSMHRLDEKGKLFLESLELPQEKITQQLVFDIISLQNKLNPYSSLESQEIRWKINKKERQ